MVLTRSVGKGAATRRSADDSAAGPSSTTAAPTPTSTIEQTQSESASVSVATSGAATEATGGAPTAVVRPPPPIASSLGGALNTGHAATAAPLPAATTRQVSRMKSTHDVQATHHDVQATHHAGAPPHQAKAWMVHMSPPRSPTRSETTLRRPDRPPPPPAAGRATSLRSRSAQSQHRLRVAHAKEQYAKLQVQLAAAHIAVLEAEEDYDDARTVISEGEQSQRVTTWLTEHRAHLTLRQEEYDIGVAPADAALPAPTAELPQQPAPHRPPMTTGPAQPTYHGPPTTPADMFLPPPTSGPEHSLYYGPLAKHAAILPPPLEAPEHQPYYEQPPPRHAVYVPPQAAAAAHPTSGAVALPPTAPRSDIAELAAAIALASRQSKSSLPSRYFIDLPVFAGSHQEWLPFRAAYNESAGNFTDVENTARLRRALKGRAREAVENLLLHYTDPTEILRTLEARFGRPEAIASTELERLRKIPKPFDTPRDICLFANRVTNVVAALRALDRVHYMYNPDVTTATSEKLPPSIRHRWFEYSATQPAGEPDLMKLARFLQREADICAPYAQPETAASAPAEPQRERRQQQRVNTAQARPCSACDTTGHDIATCGEFKSKDTNARWDIAKRARLCFKCLRFRSKTHFCKGTKCDQDGCAYYHHRLLHHHRRAGEEQKQEKTSLTRSETITAARNASAYLKIAPVTVSGPAGEVSTWALLDDGSTVTLIDDQLAERLGAHGPRDPLNISTIGTQKIDASQSRRVALTVTGRDQKPQQLQLRTIDKLTLAPQRIDDEDLRDCEHLREVRDLLMAGAGPPKILIGQDNWHLLITRELKRGRRDQPVASLTPLGWVIHGASRGPQRVNFVAHLSSEDAALDEKLKQHFALESLTIVPKTPRGDPERLAVEMLEKGTKQRTDGHFETALLWQQDDAQMPDNYDAALRRLIAVEKKNAKTPAVKDRYQSQMSSLLERGYAEPAPPKKTPGRTWYLPHFAVFNPAKPDKMRIVHDAAAKTQGRSLNDYLLTGPDLLQSLPGVLMRFRQHPVAVSADIREMFMQVKIREQDRDALRYLWRDRPEDPPSEYRMTSLIFGATSSPATAIFVKNMNATRFRERHPEACDAIIRSHYMDDYLGSYRTATEAARVAAQVRNIHADARFELAKWTSNDTTVLRALTEEGSPEAVNITGGPAYERVLGLVWRPDTDTLGFNLDLARVPRQVLQQRQPTKREALCIVMSLYDPLGIASVVTVQAKKIIQELWRRGTPWDTAIDTDLADNWAEFIRQLQALRDVAIPRCYTGYSSAAIIQLHTFVDASETAYAAALYWRITEPDGTIRTSLIVAKARVAPVKITSIPRLELQAAVMGSRMAAAITEEHDRKPNARYFWTDSRTALAWLKAGSRSFKPFVAHRIAAIEDGSSLAEWRWIPTRLNVADDATRDVPKAFNATHRWFTGPEFLRLPEEDWPSEQPPQPDLTGEERCAATTKKENALSLRESLPDATRFSKWQRYLRATARVIQFIDRCRTEERTHYKRTHRNKEKDPAWTSKKSKKAPVKKEKTAAPPSRFAEIPSDTLRRAEELIWRHSQEEAFPDEIGELKRGRPVARSSRLHRLAVIYINGTLYLRTRIHRTAAVDTARRSPTIIDGNRHEAKLLLNYIHEQLHHAGVETTINECRQHYWVLRLRPVTKMVLHSCIPCRIRRDTPPQPSTGDLPSCRLAHHHPPFSFTGWDFFGPLSTVTGRTVNKRWVAIFCCMTCRAVHLEVVWSLSTDSAVMALRRMIARRGTPIEIWSDNGTNLRGADRELRQAFDRAAEEEASKRLIRWRFLPPAAPFMAGAWERLVRTVKVALAATEQPRHPTDEVLVTLLAEAEYSVNSRPLTHVSVNDEEQEALTPNHFLLGGSARLPGLGRYEDAELLNRASWRASQRLADLFWARWLREYLPELQHRREPHSRGPALKTGDVVIIADNNLPRNTWPRGRITATYPGEDGIVRAVDVFTKGGVLRRPVKKLVLIPTSDVALHDRNCSAPADTARRENVPNDR